MSNPGNGMPSDMSSSSSPSNADRGPTINTVQILMIILSTTAVLLRFWARRLGPTRIWWDDWSILAAWAFCLGVNISILNATSLGLGKHLWNVPDGGHAYLRTLFILELLFTPAVALNKLGVLLMYHRLFGIERSFQIWLRVLAGIIVAWWIGVEVATLFQCTPIERFWEYQNPGYCFDLIVFFASSALPNVIIDVIILLLPQPYIRNLNMSWPNKIALAAIFLLGAFTALTSLGRLVAIAAYEGGYDFSWSAFSAIIWFSLEPPIGIISACLPCYGPLVRKIAGAGGSKNASFQSRGITTGGLSNRGRQSFDTESITQLARSDTASKSSRRLSVRTSVDEGGGWPGSYELNTLPMGKATSSATRKHS